MHALRPEKAISQVRQAFLSVDCSVGVPRLLRYAVSHAVQSEEGAIEALKSVADVRQEPYALPKECASCCSSFALPGSICL